MRIRIITEGGGEDPERAITPVVIYTNKKSRHLIMVGWWKWAIGLLIVI